MPKEFSIRQTRPQALRDERGRLVKGTPGNNPYGNRGKIGFSVADYTRKFLNQSVLEKNAPKRRLKILLEKAYEIACDTSNKQSIHAINFLVTRAFGEVPKELNLTVAALHTLSRLPNAHYQYFAELLAGDDESLLLPADDLAEDSASLLKDLENIPVAKSEVIE